MNPGTLIPMNASPPSQLIEPAHPSVWSGEPGTAFRPHRPLLVSYWHVLVRHKGIILFSLLVALFLDTVATLKMTRLYEAVGRIAVTRENSDVLGLKETTASAGDFWDYTVALETHVKLLQGDMLALQVIKELGLDSNPYFAGRKPSRTAGPKGSVPPSNLPGPSTSEEAALLEAFHRALTVTVLPRTQIIEIRFLSPDPRTAAQVVNALANAYIERNFQTKYESTMQASNWLSKQLADLETKVELSQEKMVRYQRENGIVAVDDKQNIVTAQLEQLNRELTAAEGDRIQKQANHVLVQAGSAELASKVDPTSLIVKLRGQQVELQNQYAQITTRFDSSYPRVRELSNQLGQINEAIQAEIARLAERSKNEYLAAADREKKLRAVLEAQKQEQNRMNESAIQFTILKHDADSNRQLYEGLLQKLKEAGITAGLKSNDTSIAGVARVPAKPVRPDIPRNIALGLLFGVVSGVALAFTLESLDNTVRTLDQVQTISALPCLGFIPAMDAKLNGNERHPLPGLASPRQDQEAGVELITLSQPQSEIAEAFRAFRTSLLLSSAGTPPQMILFTSAVPKEGKTTASINCAVVLAQKGERVLLIDADLRQPSVHQRLRIAATPGLSELLNGGAGTKGVIVRAPQLCNLFVLAAGAASSQPAELLGSQAMKSFLAKCRKQFDHIIIDSPPVLAVTDAALLSVEADAVILVARSEVTPKEALLRARDVLLGVNSRLSGVLLNAVNLRSPDLYGYSYSYEYGYPGRRGSDQQGKSADNGNQATDPELLSDPKCSHCHTTVPVIAKFCAGCGHVVMSGEPARGPALSTGTVLWSEAISRLTQQLTFPRASDPPVPQTGPVHCLNCGALLRAAVASCPECGRPVLCRVRCQGCNSELEEGARFCIECGTKAA